MMMIMMVVMMMMVLMPTARSSPPVPILEAEPLASDQLASETLTVIAPCATQIMAEGLNGFRDF